MPRAKFQTLTEQMFYILLCLREQFRAEGMIRETRVEGRRRSYLLTSFGRETLDREYRRIRAQAEDYRRYLGEE